ncbi:hypothetical protein C3492_10375 [Streptomyces sp. Ru62]|nr:hypothetical protein C3492_10375 [Streptomyces sp. Ru62]
MFAEPVMPCTSPAAAVTGSRGSSSSFTRGRSLPSIAAICTAQARAPRPVVWTSLSSDGSAGTVRAQRATCCP